MRRSLLALVLLACPLCSGCFYVTSSLCDWTRKRPAGPYYLTKGKEGPPELVFRLMNSKYHPDGWYRMREGGEIESVDLAIAFKGKRYQKKFRRGYFSCRSHFATIGGGFFSGEPGTEFMVRNQYKSGVHKEIIYRRGKTKWKHWGTLTVPLREPPGVGRRVAGTLLSIPSVALDLALGVGVAFVALVSWDLPNR
jgi:hypothetical protein